MTVADGRLPPFCWQSTAVLEVIQAAFAGQELSRALALYVAMTQLAHEARDMEHQGGFAAQRADLAERAGITDLRTIDKYVRRFEQLQILAVERRRDARKMHLPNVWRLVNPPEGAADAPSKVHSMHPPSGDERTEVGAPDAPRSVQRTHPLKKREEGEEKNPPLTPPTGRGTAPGAGVLQSTEDGVAVPLLPEGHRRRDRQKYDSELRTFAEAAYGDTSAKRLKAIDQAVRSGERTAADVTAFLRRWWPQLEEAA